MSNRLAKEDKNWNLHLGREEKTQTSEKKKGNAHKLLQFTFCIILVLFASVLFF